MGPVVKKTEMNYLRTNRSRVRQDLAEDFAGPRTTDDRTEAEAPTGKSCGRWAQYDGGLVGKVNETAAAAAQSGTDTRLVAHPVLIPIKPTIQQINTPTHNQPN